MENFDKEKEFESAISNFGGIITKVCYYFSTDTDEFKDLRQEVMYNIWKGWDKFRNDSKISTWIYRISFNTCVSFQRKEKKVKETLKLEEIVDIPEEDEIPVVEKYNQMHGLIQNLSYEDRAIILMWLDERSYEEIAELMGLKRNTLAVRLKRIKEKLINMSEKL